MKQTTISQYPMNKRSVLLAIGSSEIGGGQRVFVSLAKELVKREIGVIVVLPPGPLTEIFDTDEIKIQIIDFRFLFRSLFPIARLLKRENILLINCYLTKCCLIVSLVNLFFGIPICCTLLNAVIHEKLSRIKKILYPSLYRVLSKLSDGLIVNSNENKENLIKTASIASQSIEVIYSGIDIDEFGNAVDFCDSKQIFTIGAVGRLSIEKGFKYLIDALALLDGFDFQCIIIGEGPERTRLEEAVRCNKLDSKVKFLGFQQKVAEFIKMMNVVVVPSLNETFGITIVEAFAMKRLVIASSIGGIPELVHDKVTGLLFPPKDNHALAERISFVYKNPDETRRMVENAHRLMREKFTSSIMAENTLTYYNSLSLIHPTERKHHNPIQ